MSVFQCRCVFVCLCVLSPDPARKLYAAVRKKWVCEARVNKCLVWEGAGEALLSQGCERQGTGRIGGFMCVRWSSVNVGGIHSSVCWYCILIVVSWQHGRPLSNTAFFLLPGGPPLADVEWFLSHPRKVYVMIPPSLRSSLSAGVKYAATKNFAKRISLFLKLCSCTSQIRIKTLRSQFVEGWSKV